MKEEKALSAKQTDMGINGAEYADNPQFIITTVKDATSFLSRKRTSMNTMNTELWREVAE